MWVQFVVLWMGVVGPGCLEGLAASRSVRNSGSIRSTTAQPVTVTPSAPSRNFTGRGSRSREQYLFNVFEVIVSTLESKLQRIENLDKAVLYHISGSGKADIRALLFF
ncbi:uncharacterized protein LOC120351791 [Nilaparvata lugens]|uniref:uncharacterized protein LOC120351791 n=1 Tax=Nilaparvata lugens TaxID=108931 RepID=UPI00193CC601|nr:uncharacterized protein LOC120351791 [Nilaparvata lugens]